MNVFVTLALILAVVVAGGIAVALSGRVRWAQPLQDPVSTVPPVLLPAHPRAQDLAQLRFATGLRGYRMDQVDHTLRRLALALEERDRRIAELEAERATISGAAHSSE